MILSWKLSPVVKIQDIIFLQKKIHKIEKVNKPVPPGQSAESFAATASPPRQSCPSAF